MRKLFLLIPAMLLSLAMSAATHEIGSGTSNILGTTVASASDGDVIILTDNGPYVNVWKEKNGDDYTRLEKNLTIKAADGKNPVIKYTVPFRSRYGKTVKFIGIKFDGSEMSHYDYYFLFYNNDDNNLEFENCEFTGMSKYMLYVYSGMKANSIVLKNCNIHDNTNRVVYNKATINKLVMENTEISNSSHYIIHNNAATLDSCILKNCNIHNNTERGILNEATINNIMIDGGKFYNFTGDYPAIQNYNNATIGKLELDGVEFYGNKKACIHGTSTSHLGSCYINNCYFHNNKKNSVLFEKSTVATAETIDEFVMTHTTIANNDSLTDSNSHVYIRAYNDDENNTIKVKVDHCTCYNNPTLNYDHSNFRFYHIKDVTITNCIFAHAWPATDVDETHKYARYAALSGGSPAKVSNCIAYNYLKNESGFSGADVINYSKADPLFADAANGDFHIGASSPAVLAGDNGTPLGAKRWWPTITYPATSFASAYDLVGADAQLIGNIRLNANSHIDYYDKSVCGQAAWPIHVSNACAVQAAVDMETGSSSGCKLQLFVYDTEGNAVDSIKANTVSDDVDFVIPGTIYFPAEGNYTIVLRNAQSWSSAKVEKISLSYSGGAVQAIPGTTNINEAWFSSNGTRANDMISFSSYSNQWIKWNMALTGTDKKAYDFTLNVSNPSKYGHRFYITIYEEGVEDPIATLSEHAWNKSYKADGPLALNLGSAMLEGGKNYTVKVTNAESGAQPKIISITTAYSGGNVIDIPATLNVADAWFTSGATRANNQITYSSWNTADSWVKWNVATNDYLYCDVKLNISTDNGHEFYVALYEDEAEEPIVSLHESFTSEDHEVSKEINLGRINLPSDKKYVVKVTNPVSGSHAKVDNLQFVEVVAPTVSLPATLLPADAMLSSEAWIDNDSILFTARGSEGHNSVNWAKWKVRVEEKGLYNFTAYVSRPSGEQKYEIALLSLDESTEIFTPYADNDIASGDQTTSTGAKVLEAGDYILRIRNTYNYAESRLLKVEVKRGAISLDEMAENNTVIAANEGFAADIQLSRSFLGGMYNTVCAPFAANAQQLENAFGAGYELLAMSEATLDGAVLTLNFTAATSMEAGKPYLVRPNADIANPKFLGVTISETEPIDVTGENADFIGTFIQTSLEADRDLFLGQNNILHFPSSTSAPLKGLRAYFHISAANAQAIKRARIVTQEQVITEIDLVNGENQGLIKTIENGQLIINLDGIRYNIMGGKIK